jgi:hypothetical protein
MGLEETKFHPKGEKNNKRRLEMILTGKMNQVTLKRSEEDVTGRMGLSWMGHSMRAFGLEEIIDRWSPRESGSNREILASRKVMAGALSLVAGGERIEDVEVLRKDRGLLNSMGWEEMISADTLREYLKVGQNAGRLRKGQEEFVMKAMRQTEHEELTYDNDATYFDSEKDSASYSYQKKKQYSGLMGFIAELGVCNTVDFRPGNVSPSKGVLNQLRKAVSQAKKVDKRIVKFRSDSAAHDHRIFDFCEEKGIQYYVSLSKNEAIREIIGELKEECWKEKEGYGREEGRRVEWAEAVYSMNKGATMRMLVLRWLNPEPDLFETEKYCYHAIGTNDSEIEPMAWLDFHNGRMNSENYNKELKEGLNGGYAPSHDFDMDRGYFLLNVLAYNIVQVMKLFYLGKEAKLWTVKTLRYRFIQVCGKIIRTGRKYYCKIINATQESFELFRHCWSRLLVA